MAKINFNVACIAVYKSSLEIPREIENDEEKILDYIHNNLEKANVESELAHINDLSDPYEAVTKEDLRGIEHTCGECGSFCSEGTCFKYGSRVEESDIAAECFHL